MGLADLTGFKAIITAGGVGTRLLPFSKEIPKEMSPIFIGNKNEIVLVKPVIQAIFEQLYSSGVRDFFVVVGRGKRAIEDHFTVDSGFLEFLNQKGKSIEDLSAFYAKLKSSNLVFVMQPEPLGFGDAVLRVRPFLSGEFLVFAGDTFVISQGDSYLERIKAAHRKYEADATILLNKVANPANYGVVVGQELEKGILRIQKAVEKPVRFLSNTAIMPVYLFNDSIFSELEDIATGKGKEIQLTDAIQHLIEKGKPVVGVMLEAGETRLDIGSPETLLEALKISSEQLKMD